MLEPCSVLLIQDFSPSHSRNQLSSLELAKQQAQPTTDSWLDLTTSLSRSIHCATQTHSGR
ncbi:hypothetical protein BCR37DRAFT_377950 [Protomyces lactucae-debilis]|uniref:Uncharacterized protein n=1 Tax=Protomyces lactucae-debilis TaxID=2754530 RepID=A0A1Y2FLY0_PROLT|nr:uncharacterized protein BCR37DRAFT_377950 [Protomyces lactucae-debilis]ORY84981.1 hypothetical protein BCR37DRAFT_377950 [Protomyces lactucae-debilis]